MGVSMRLIPPATPLSSISYIAVRFHFYFAFVASREAGRPGKARRVLLECYCLLQQIAGLKNARNTGLAFLHHERHCFRHGPRHPDTHRR
jgi:hypothetical protein